MELERRLFVIPDDALLTIRFFPLTDICLGGLTEEDLVMLPVLDLGLLTC